MCLTLWLVAPRADRMLFHIQPNTLFALFPWDRKCVMRFKYPGKGEFKCLPTYSGLRKEAPKMEYKINKQIIVKEISFSHHTQS